MNVLRTWALLSPVVALAASSPMVRADDAQDILGVWTPVGLESDGVALSADQVKTVATKLTFTITKEKIAAPLSGGATEIEYRLSPETTPKGIDTTDLNGPMKGETRKGIYEFQEGLLRLCIAGKNASRPVRFSTKPGEEGNGDIVVTLQRKK